MNRRNFIKLATIFTAGIFAGCSTDKNIGNLNINYLRRIITKNPETSACIMWQTDSPLKNPVMEIANKKIPAIDSSFEDDGENIFQYTAQIDNLNANTDYKFRIVDGDNHTDYFNLRTADNNKFKAIIFPDSQSADYNVWGDVAKVAFEKNPDAKFFVNVGDIVDNGEDINQWRAWFDKISAQIKNIPFVPVMGNHETYNRDWQVRSPIQYLNYFAVPDNGSDKFSRRFYSFDYGAAHFVILDSQWDELGKDIINVQKKFLREDIANTKKTWRVAFIHKDVLQYRINGRPERLEGFSDVGEIFMPIFEELNFDVVFTAHLHTYRNRGRLKNFRADDSGTLYILTGLAGDVRYSNLWIDHALDKVIAPQPEIDNYLTLEIDENNLLVKCFLYDGSQIDEYILQKGV